MKGNVPCACLGVLGYSAAQRNATSRVLDAEGGYVCRGEG